MMKRNTNQKAFLILSLLVGIFLLLFSADQADFPDIYIDASAGDGGVGSQADPYNDFADINWTTGGDNSIFDYLAGSPSQSPTIYLNKGDTWREQMSPGCSGTATYPIVITSYGSGNDPILNGTALITPGTAWSEATTTFTVGNDSSEAAKGRGANYIYVGEIDTGVGETGTLKSITIYIGSSLPNNVKLAIYDDSSNAPNNLIANTATEEKTSGQLTQNDWNTFNVSGGATLSASTRYWPGFWGNSLWDGPGGTDSQTVRYSSVAYDGWPASWSDSGGGEDIIGMYFTLEQAAPNVWKATCTTEPHMVFMDGTFGDVKGSQGALVNEYDWWWDSNVLYIYSTTDPDTAYTSPGVETGAYPATDGQGLIEIPANTDYITIDGLSVTQSDEVGIDMRSASSNIIVKNCTVNDCWHGGITAWGSGGGGCSDITFQDNTVYNVERMGVSGYNEAITVAYTTTFEISGNAIYDYGVKEGIDAKQSSTAGLIFDNTLYDGRIGIYIDSAYDIDVYNNNIYNQAWQGILLSNETDTHACDSVDIYYNIIRDVSDGIKYYIAGGSSNDISNIDVYNNTIYTCDNCIKWDTGIETKYSGTNNLKNNIIWALGATYAIKDDSASEVGISGTTIDYNCFRTGCTTETTGTNPVNTADPLFTDAGNNDFTLQSGSPCIDAGIDVGLNQDYAGNPVPLGGVDIGAYEEWSLDAVVIINAIINAIIDPIITAIYR